MGLDRVVDVAEHGRRLSLDRGFLVVADVDREIGRVALDDIGSVMLSAYGTSCTTPLAVALAERGVPTAVCGKNHLPVAWTFPIVGHHAQTRIFAAQVDAKKPMNKRLWKYIVQAKISAQADALGAMGRERWALDRLVPLVQSGDPANVEGRAAAIYWPELFGQGFRRDRDASGINAVLNYGYTVLRAATARAIVCCGLHPSLSIQHRRDPMALADDLMEPFRPIVDCRVAALAGEERAQVTREVRTELVELLGGDVDRGLLQFVRSIAKAYVEGTCPTWRRRHVAADLLRFADDDHCREESGAAVAERPSESRLRTDPTVCLREEVPWSDDDDDA
jgi:CRISP-associated protein Cas1